MFALHIWSFIIRTRRLRKIFGLQQSKLGLFWFRPWSVDRIPLSLDNWLSTHYSESWCIMFIVYTFSIDENLQCITRLLSLQKSRENKKGTVCSSNCGSRSSHLEAEPNQSRAMATHVLRPNPKQHQEEGEAIAAASILRGRLWSWLGRNLEGCFWCTPNFITCCIAIGGQPTEDHHVQYPMILGRCHHKECGLTKRGYLHSDTDIEGFLNFCFEGSLNLAESRYQQVDSFYISQKFKNHHFATECSIMNEYGRWFSTYPCGCKYVSSCPISDGTFCHNIGTDTVEYPNESVNEWTELSCVWMSCRIAYNQKFSRYCAQL